LGKKVGNSFGGLPSFFFGKKERAAGLPALSPPKGERAAVKNLRFLKSSS
jgi:hypothetical protein